MTKKEEEQMEAKLFKLFWYNLAPAIVLLIGAWWAILGVYVDTIGADIKESHLSFSTWVDKHEVIPHRDAISRGEFERVMTERAQLDRQRYDDLNTAIKEMNRRFHEEIKEILKSR